MPSFKLAASNIAWFPKDDQVVLEKMRQWGFSGLEIAPTRLCPNDPYDHPQESIKFAQTVEDQFGLTICSMQSIWRGRRENLFDPDGATALADITEKALSYAEALKCPNLVFGCPGNRVIPEGCTADNALPFFERLNSIAAQHQSVIALEPNPPIYHTNFLNTTSEVFSFLESMPDAHRLTINLDFGAIVYNKESIHALEPVIPYVSHIHISEPHLAPIEERTEHRELKALLQDCGYSNFVSLEMAAVDHKDLYPYLSYMAEVFL